jgi:ParB-like chromosome segregation protein Spo0J
MKDEKNNIEKVKLIKEIKNYLNKLDFEEKVHAINQLREVIHNESPFKNEPVDFVKWVKNDNVIANDYNPNKVAPPEMELLEISIMNDGYTQPIVTWNNAEKGKTEVIDGFHRNRVGKESKIVNQRVKGYLPIVDIRKEQSGKNDRIASTIRHNRARGKHSIDGMANMVFEMLENGMSDESICKELGMSAEEINRLKHVTGFSKLFEDTEYKQSWKTPKQIQLEKEYRNEQQERQQLD